jgi:hypothetical protein
MDNNHQPEDVHYWDTENVASYILGLPQDSDSEEVEAAVMARFSVDLFQWSAIVRHLIPLADAGESPLTGVVYRGFSAPEGSGRGWLANVPVDKNEEKEASHD